MNIDRVLELMQDVPDYQTFLTVDELEESTHRLAERFPKVVELHLSGYSRQGSPITVIKIGSGSRKGLLFAMPHPNEPIGSMMLEFLSNRLAEDDVLRTELDYTWYIIKCIDIDGARLNEGWFKGPFSVTNYARHFYRPPSHLQVEWSFPIDYKNLHFNQPLPETQALMKLVEEIKPDFIFSLHNSGFGGAYAYLSHDTPAFYPYFYRVVESQDLPLHLGEAEVPYARTLSKAVYRMFSTEDSYDFLKKNGVVDPASLIKSGASSYAYSSRFGDPQFIICEMPYFYNSAIRDTSSSDMSRREATLAKVEQSKRHARFLREQYDFIKNYLSIQSPFRTALENTISHQMENLAAEENWAKSNPAMEVRATVAEKLDCFFVHRFYDLLSIGMFVRMIQTEIDASGETAELLAGMKTAQRWFNEETAALEKEMEYEVIPIQKLVRVQLGAGLLFADLVRR